MNKNLIKFFTLITLIFSQLLFAQQKNLWSKIDEAKISISDLQRTANIKKYQTFHLRMDDLILNLKKAPNKKINVEDSGFKMQFPDKNGKMVSFLVKEAPVMHPDLAKKYPDNKSYKGIGLEDSTLKIRFSVNKKGLHAMIIDKFNRIQYIDPITKNLENYKIYMRKDMDAKNTDFQCFTNNLNALKKLSNSIKSIDDRKLRTYRLAIAATGEYSQYHIDLVNGGGGTDAEKKAIVMAEMTTAMTRINAIFENDLAITMELVPANADIIYLDGTTDPYTNDDGNKMLSQNQTTCDNVIGSGNYDIGHVFSTGGGGVASLGVTCGSSKARGVTGISNPVGDHFYFDFVAHEFGHQFGANHTFNGDTGNCSGSNRNDATAVEPGSGSTLMAYASLCSPQNVQSHSDLYFHVVSIDEIWNYITSGSGTCGVETNLTTNLFVPTANAGNDFTIPISTAYVLKGQGADGDSDPISFSWEQMDNQITDIPPSETALSGALYRSVNPKLTGRRYLPELLTVVNGSVSSKWEVTPAVAREINFKLTVRDNNAEAGQVASDAMKVTVTDAAGPFVVTSQNIDNLVWDQNTTQSITWNVAGTTTNGVNVSNVNIWLSADGGRTFPTILASNTPNDGNQDITVPNFDASKCFIMVEAVGNFFYAINTKTFSIGNFNEVCTVYDATDTPLSIPDDDPNGIFSTISITDNYIVEKVIVNVRLTHTYMEDISLSLESPNGTVIELIGNACGAGDDMDVSFDDNGIDLVCGVTPPVISGIIKPIQSLYDFVGESSFGSWKLKAVDNNFDDIGTIDSWSIELCTSEIVLGVNNYVFDNFKVYPNPSNGIFNIEFNSKNTNNVEISVYDLLGRKLIEKRFFTSNTLFKEVLNFSHITNGLYILRVKRGNEISSQKIQIN